MIFLKIKERKMVILRTVNLEKLEKNISIFVRYAGMNLKILKRIWVNIVQENVWE
jgi:hypothetical protein